MKRFLGPIVAVALGAPFAAAHDFWLVPVGAAIEARTGSRFPVSTNAVAPSRLAEAVAVSAAGREALAVVGIRDSALVLRADPAIGGAFWVAVGLDPRRIDLTAEQFNDYLLEDGLAQIHPGSEEHTSEIPSRLHLVCPLLLGKKNNTNYRKLAP